MKEKVLITGAGGLIAKNLGKILLHSGYNICFLSSNKKNLSSNTFYWNFEEKYIDENALHNVDHIIHLAGYNIASNWNKKNKKLMRDSRLKTSELIYNKFVDLKTYPKTFISASAMGYYGFNQNGTKNETEKPGTDWMAQLCVDWESCADQFTKLGSNVIKLRLPLVLDKNAEILKKSLMSFYFGFGVVFANGQQKLPWIHIEDVVRFIAFALKNKKLKGVYNIASRDNISHYQFIDMIKKVKYTYSMLIYMPQLLIKLIFFKKHVLLLNNISLDTKKIQNENFELKYPTIEKAITNLLL